MFTYEVLGDGLVYYKNLIPNPGDIINDLENLDAKLLKDLSNNVHGSHASIFKTWHNWDHEQEGLEKMHFCKQVWLSRTKDIQPHDIYKNEYSSISDRLFNSLDTAFDHYRSELYPLAAMNIKGGEDRMSILKYEKAGFLSEHSDHGSSSRTLSVVLYLNDDYVGGEIVFPYVRGGISIKPEKGSAIFFPSNYVFAHYVKEITEGIRYALPNWYHNMNPKIYTDGSV